MASTEWSIAVGVEERAELNDLGRRLARLAWLTGATDPTMFFHADAKVDEKTYRRDIEPFGITMEEITATMEVEEGHLFDVDDRMEYVKKILKKYHKLMTEGTDHSGQRSHRDYMIGQMKIIAERWRSA